MNLENILITNQPELKPFIEYNFLPDNEINEKNIHMEVSNIYTAIGVNISLGRSTDKYECRLSQLRHILGEIS